MRGWSGSPTIEGLEYHLTDAGLTGNTLDAHQLLQLGKARGIQDAVIERLYRAYFTEQRSVFDRDSLVTLAGEAGLDQAEARDVLERDAYVDAVAADVREARVARRQRRALLRASTDAMACPVRRPPRSSPRR